MRRNTSQKMAAERVFRPNERPLGIDDGFLKRFSHQSLGTLYKRTRREHHHHFNYRVCGHAFKLPVCLLKEEGVATDGLIVEDHDIYLFCVCPSCVERTT